MQFILVITCEHFGTLLRLSMCKIWSPIYVQIITELGSNCWYLYCYHTILTMIFTFSYLLTISWYCLHINFNPMIIIILSEKSVLLCAMHLQSQILGNVIMLLPIDERNFFEMNCNLWLLTLEVQIWKIEILKKNWELWKFFRVDVLVLFPIPFAITVFQLNLNF